MILGMENLWLIGNRRGVPPDVGRIGNPPYAEHQICWSITANPREPNLYPDLEALLTTQIKGEQNEKNNGRRVRVIGWRHAGAG